MKKIENIFLLLKTNSIYLRLLGFIIFTTLMFYIFKYKSIEVIYQYAIILVLLAIIIPVTISQMFKIRVYIVIFLLLLLSGIYKYYPMDSFLLFDYLNQAHKMNYNDFIKSANIIFKSVWLSLALMSFTYTIFIIVSKLPVKENMTPQFKKEYFNLKLLQNLLFY